MILRRGTVPVFILKKLAAHNVKINSSEFWQKVKLAIVSLIEECVVRPNFQNDRGILNIKMPNKIANGHDILD